MADYNLLAEQLTSLISGVPHRTANLANAAALIFNGLDGVNWAGFYFIENGTLVLDAFCGKPACIEIPLGKGVCGTAAKDDRTVVVPDVHLFPGHIACDSASQSETVVPLHKGGKVVGVLDIDSPVKYRFNEDDGRGIESLARVIEDEMEDLL